MKTNGIEVLRNVFDQLDQEWIISDLSKMSYRPCPSFLGKFDYSQYRNLGLLGPTITNAILKLIELVPVQGFNTVFIQRYLDGAYVAPHRDPRNNFGKTIIAVFGTFQGALSHHDGFSYRANNGDVVIQDCTINGVQGAIHSVDPIMGSRYAIILNTIQR